VKNPDKAKRIQKVPADLVLASGSGLDPHVTMKAAEYQLPDVIDARVEQTKLPRADVEGRIREILKAHSFQAFGFLGEPLVNVLEVNLALDREFGDK
jgi:K+-transporting ATPase ATPase C chain